MTSTGIRLVLLVASPRSGVRFADVALRWIGPRLAEVSDIEVDVVDVREHPLPSYDLPRPPAVAPRQYESPEHRAVGERFDAADGFLVLTNEFNHGYSGAMKNLLDHYFTEFVHKPIAFVGYGNVGGARAIEQLRLVAAELDMVSVRETVNITGVDMRALRTGDQASAELIWAAHLPKWEAMLTNLLWWSRTLRAGRHAPVEA